MRYPSKTQVKKALQRLRNAEGTRGLPDTASPLDRFRFDLQQTIVHFSNENGLSQREMAALLGIDPPKMSKIFHHRLEEFSTDRLVRLCEKLYPKLRLRVG
ncbi:MAG: XRE family transcriptional regulator [Bdellovibrionales bacterium]|nr:XRE family transcriptional regulator [Bdellovibrionales bacterium]